MTFSLFSNEENHHQPLVVRLEPIDTPQDIAREHINKQCNDLSRQHRFSRPTYSVLEMSAVLCSGWSVDDFACAAEYAAYAAMQQGRSHVDIEHELLRRYELYRIPAFHEYIKTVPDYRSHIKALRDRLVAQKPKWYKVWRRLGFLDPQYVHKLDLLEKLHAENLKEEREEQRVAQRQQRQRELQAHQELQNKHEATRITFDQQRESLSQISDEWMQIQDIYQYYDLCDNGRYERRKQALDFMANGGFIYETKSYTVSPAAMQLIRDMGTDVTEY